MLPEEFVEFSNRFEIGFLTWIRDEKPTMERTYFLISTKKISVKPLEYDPFRIPPIGSKVTLIFANPWYAEKCEMGMVRGDLKLEGDKWKIDPLEITWTLAFDVDRYPERIVKRWKKR
jgi:hypothetical protein